MKKNILIIISLLLFFSCADTKKIMNQSVYNENTKQTILLGAINKSGLISDSYGEWFNPNFNNYTLNNEILEQISPQMLKGVKTKLVLATWCGDSKREVPHFYKIMEALKYSEKNIEAISVDRSKKAEGYDLDALNISRVPTFIFFKDNKEIGRITERPIVSLEEDLLQILKK